MHRDDLDGALDLSVSDNAQVYGFVNGELPKLFGVDPQLRLQCIFKQALGRSQKIAISQPAQRRGGWAGSSVRHFCDDPYVAQLLVNFQAVKRRKLFDCVLAHHDCRPIRFIQKLVYQSAR